MAPRRPADRASGVGPCASPATRTSLGFLSVHCDGKVSIPQKRAGVELAPLLTWGIVPASVAFSTAVAGLAQGNPLRAEYRRAPTKDFAVRQSARGGVRARQACHRTGRIPPMARVTRASS